MGPQVSQVIGLDSSRGPDFVSIASNVSHGASVEA